MYFTESSDTLESMILDFQKVFFRLQSYALKKKLDTSKGSDANQSGFTNNISVSYNLKMLLIFFTFPVIFK